jgi:hypothetical protein
MALADRSVNSAHYHVWTDALHARELARTAANKWDRGTYVRWTIVSAWTAFEVGCEMALGVGIEDARLGRRFKEHLNLTMQALGLPKTEWGSGLWQNVLEVLQSRNDYVHLKVPQERLFADVPQAEHAIVTLRAALIDLCRTAGATTPDWMDEDIGAGWDGGRSMGVHATVIRAGAQPDDPHAIRIAYVYKGETKISEILPPGSDPAPALEKLRRDIVIPITAVRAYEGTVLLNEIPVQRRGA